MERQSSGHLERSEDMADIVNGIQINKLPEATSVSDEDILILENAERTQKVSAKKLVESMLSPSLLNLIIPKNAGARNSNFRGAYLGAQATAAQYQAISTGQFDDLFVGDYWAINGTVYRIAGLDILLNTGDTQLTKHHAVIVPDKNMYSAKMNDENTTDGGYYNSVMKQKNLEQALTQVKADFGAEHIIKHKALLTNVVTGDNPSGWLWYDTEIDLMTERQVYGSPAWGQAAHNGYDANMQYSRFPLFALAPEYITNRAWYWLQDVRSSIDFCGVDGYGGISRTGASNNFGVRPYFLIGNQI